MALSRDAILGVNDLQVEKVFVPEWGDEVIIRGLTGEELDAYQGSRRQIRNAGTPQAEVVFIQDNARAGLLVKCIVDENGDRIFTDQDAGLLGMNVGGVPLAQHPHGFWVVLGFTALVTGGLAWLLLRLQRPR